MHTKNEKITLPEGIFNAELQIFDESDRDFLRSLYNKWNELSKLLEDSGGRRLNIPELISEAIFCIEFNAVRVTKSIGGANSSFDCFNLKDNKRIQVKACSVNADLTSFGPKSVWDEIYFVHMLPINNYDGSYNIYKIDNASIYNHKVNKEQTMKEQQLLGKRPRFSILQSLIQPNNLQPLISKKL
jgi:hypothetical protein